MSPEQANRGLIALALRVWGTGVLLLWFWVALIALALPEWWQAMVRVWTEQPLVDHHGTIREV